jgi:hypothetical protein
MQQRYHAKKQSGTSGRSLPFLASRRRREKTNPLASGAGVVAVASKNGKPNSWNIPSTNNCRILPRWTSIVLGVGVVGVLFTIAALMLLSHRRMVPNRQQLPPIPTATNYETTKDAQNTTMEDTDDIVLQFPIHLPLPEWMTEYMAWHTEQLQHIDANNWKQEKHRYLIARCLDIDRACGGVSDRLKSIPTLLLLARLSNRILFIHWNRPVRLEEMLTVGVPSSASTINSTKSTSFLNWTVPSFIPVKGAGTRLYTKLTTLIKATTVQNSTVPVLCARIQDQHGGSEFYNANHHRADHLSSFTNPSAVSNHRAFRHVFRSVFFTLFRPSNHVLQQLGHILHDELHLNPGRYDVVHFRAYYSAAISSSQDSIAPWAINAVYCAYQHLNHIQLVSSTTTSRFLPENTSSTGVVPAAVNRPILFLSDSNVAVQAVRNHFSASFSSSSSPIRVLTLSRDADPMHLDKSVVLPSGGNTTTTDAYLDVFVDLLLMAHARCIAHGQGGYGRFGVLLSANPTCFFKYFENSQWKMCEPSQTVKLKKRNTLETGEKK